MQLRDARCAIVDLLSSMTSSLSLDRGLQNSRFDSWKIGSDFVQNRSSIDLPGEVFQGASDAVDFLHTRAAVLRNHLIESQGRLFVVTRADHAAELHEVASSAAGEVLQLTKIADIPLSTADATDPLTGTTVEAALHCSVAVVALPTTAEGLHVGAAAGSLVASTGQGDLTLVHTAATGQVSLSNVVFPLRPSPPLLGVRPFTIEAAWSTHTGYVRCVVTALATISDNNRSSHPHQPRGVCETWLITLKQEAPHQAAAAAAAASSPRAAGPGVSVVGKQLLMVSRSPPAAAVAACITAAGSCGSSSAAGTERVLLVGEPPLEDEELPAGYAPATAAGAGAAAPDQPAAARGSTADPMAAAAAAGVDGVLSDADDMDLDARTLQQAAARLAQFTSDKVIGELPQQQWTDVFKESGPTELSDAELAVEVMLFATSRHAAADTAQLPAVQAAAAGTTNESNDSSTAAAGSTNSTLPAPLTLTSSVSCGPHRLLAVQALHPGSSSSSSSQGQAGLLLGLTDDVDCAVVAAQLTTGGGTSGATAQAAAGSSSSSGCSVVLSHQANLPALAYVVAGKTQRRHLLLGGGASSPVCGVLVEGRQYTYLYGQVAVQQAHGQQQIVDMQLPPGSSILGARLLQDSSSSRSLAVDEAAAGATGGGSSPVRLLLLTSSQLVCFTLRAPQ